MLFNPYKTTTLVAWLKSQIPITKFNVFGFVAAMAQVYCFIFVLPPIIKQHWPTEFIAKFPKSHFVAALTIIGHTGVVGGLNIFMWGIYKLNHPFFEQYKNTTEPWPWEANAERWKETLKRTLKVIAFLHFVVFPIDIYFKFVVLARADFHVDVDSFPSGFTISKHILFCMIVEDFLTYWAHRLMHHPYFYAKYHKMHHEYSETVMLAAEYSHPFEYVTLNLIPSALAVLLLQGRVHLVTHMLWMTLRLTRAGDNHCGYDFPWSPFQYIPFGTGEAFHDFHHTNNIGNYASFFTVWDTLMGTNHRLPENDKIIQSPASSAKKKKKAKQVKAT